MKSVTPDNDPPPAAMNSALSLRLLGEPCLCRLDAAGEPQIVLGVGKPLALLTYLTVSPQHEATREFLADLLWGADSVSDPGHSLRNALVSLKNVIGPDVIDATMSRCRLARPIRSDLDTLGEALRAGRLSDVVALYTGEFFAGFAAPGCQQFELWCDSVRHRVRTEVANAADVQVRRLLDAGHAREAAQVARRMTQIEPFGQRARRALLEALIAANDDLGALTEAAVLEEWLQAEELEPEPATRALMARARKGPPKGRRHNGEARGALSPDLIGREAEFGEIVLAWERARNGGPEFVAVNGGAGVGKSRLLADTANRLRAERARVVTVGALPGERELPFALLAALVGALAPLVEVANVSASTARVLASLDPSLAERYGVAPDTSSTDPVLRRAFALRELLGAVAERRSTAVFIDDVHWADEASVDAILAALTRLSDARMLVVTASRPNGRHPLPPDRVRVVSLVPLSTEQLGQLVASVRPLPNEAWAADVSGCLHAASGGIPLFAILALRDAEDAGLLIAGETEWECRDPSALVRHLTQGTVLTRSLRDIPPHATRVLSLLALAGRAVPQEFLRLTDNARPSGNDANALVELESRALIVRQGDRCAIAHDLVTEAALASLTEVHRAQWARELGLAMLATNEQQWIERGVRLLADVTPPGELALRLAPVFQALPYAHGVSVERVLASWLGQAPEHQAYAVALSRRLPAWVRFRPFRRRAGAALVAILLLSTVTAWATRHPTATVDATLVVLDRRGENGAEAIAVPLSASEWETTAPLAGRRDQTATALAAFRGRTFPPLQLLSTGEILWNHDYPDSGGGDIDVVDDRGNSSRITSSPGDDGPCAWSPDGRFVLIESSRWSPLKHHQLGILDRQTGAVRRLTRGDGLEADGIWSPDGSRIAFSRRFLDDRPTLSCVIDVSGAGERCTVMDVQLLGWRSPSELLLATATHVLSMRVGSPESVDTLSVNASSGPSLSPNGRWLSWWGGPAMTGDVFVAPYGDLTKARRVRLPRSVNTSRSLAWGRRGVMQPYIETVSIASRTDTVMVGVPHQLDASARWSDGSTAPPPYVHWRVDLPDDGYVDSSGTFVARRAGPINVIASVGGWRTTSRRMVAVPASSRLGMVVDWSKGLEGWRGFGEPAPAIVQDTRLGPAFLNNGDGTYFSGAYYRQTFNWSGGLAIDAVLRTPVTELQWQRLDLALFASDVEGALVEWDHRTGYMPPTSRGPEATCRFIYPASEGAAGLLSIVAAPNVTGPTAQRRLVIGDGRPYRVRLQIFPDGRCALAVNGKSLGVLGGRFAPGVPLRLAVSGSSWKTRMLLGPLTIWRGVPDDIDWTHVAHTIPATMPPGPSRSTTPHSPK